MCNCADKETIYFAKVRPDAKIPTKRDEDGCYDIYACFEYDVDVITLEPGELMMIPTGIASACSKKYRFGARERGSTGSKGLSTRAGQIDSGYRGEWFIILNNTSNKTVNYPASKAIAQIALEEVPDVHVEEITYDELKTMESERGEGCLGSSKK